MSDDEVATNIFMDSEGISHIEEQDQSVLDGKCPQCPHKSANWKHLFRHLRSKHGPEGSEIAEKMMGKKEEFKCHFCTTLFKSRKCQRKHEKKFHEVLEPATSKSSQILCQEKKCSWSGQQRQQLRNHLERAHSLSFDMIPEMSFQSAAEFEKWFQDEFENAQQPASFIEKQSIKLHGENEGRVRVVRECGRSGVYTEKEDRKRRKFDRGTTKVGYRCTLQITYVKEPDGRITMEEACRNHYGHDATLKHTLLAKTDRLVIAGKAALGVSADRILQDMNAGIGVESESVLRKQLVTKKDVFNIISAYGIQSDYHRHGNDADSVDIRAKEMQDAGTCLYYKPQKKDDPRERSNLQFDDFVLVIQTKLQWKLLIEFGEKFVCLDSTHHTSRYHFQLYTLMVADEEGAGQPVAHMITNREECEGIVELFCWKVRENLREESCNFSFVMTDDKSCLYDGLVAGFKMEENPPRKLLCTWHLRRNVSSHAYNKMKDKHRAEYWYGRFTHCQELQKEESFKQEWDELLSSLEAEEEAEGVPESQRFVTYLRKQYDDRTEQWGYYFRKGAGINVNMLLEAFHKVLKYVYWNKNVGMRLDKTLHGLLNLIHQKAVERIRKLEFGFVKKRSEILDRHESSMKGPQDFRFPVHQWQKYYQFKNDSLLNFRDIIQKLDMSFQLKTEIQQIMLHLTDYWTCKTCRTQTDQKMVQCGSCEEWHHMSCVHYKEGDKDNDWYEDLEETDESEDWWCVKCTKRSESTIKVVIE